MISGTPPPRKVLVYFGTPATGFDTSTDARVIHHEASPDASSFNGVRSDRQIKLEALKLKDELIGNAVLPGDHIIAVADGVSGQLAVSLFSKLPQVSPYRFSKLEILPASEPQTAATAGSQTRAEVPRTQAAGASPTGWLGRKVAGLSAAAYQTTLRLGMSAAHGLCAVVAKVSLEHLLATEFVTPTLGTLARLGIVDTLPATSAEVAEKLQLSPEGTDRLLRASAAAGVVKLHGDTFSPTRMGKYLKTDHPQSLKPLAMMLADPAHWNSWGHLTYAVRTGQPAVEQALGFRNVFDYYATQPEEEETFNQGMTAISRSVTGSIGKYYDFSGCQQIVDVGGGHGNLLSSVLKAAPQAEGVLFDQPQVVAGAGAQLQQAGVADRVKTVGGSFVDSVPPGADMYLMKNILHDWNDEQCIHILSNIRQAMPPDGKLLLVEALVTDKPSPSDFMNLHMLVMNGGKERTIRQFQSILEASGLELSQSIPTMGPFHLLEVKPKPADRSPADNETAASQATG